MSEERLRNRVAYHEDYLREKITHMADTMREHADRFEREALQALNKQEEDAPDYAASVVMNGWSNHVINLRLDLIPHAAVQLTQSRRDLAEYLGRTS